MNVLPFFIIIIIFVLISLYYNKAEKKPKKCNIYSQVKNFLNLQKKYIKSKKNYDSDLDSSDSESESD